ncbi:putative aliphatic sulfonates transport permease protein SsuC [mine drainage metagenome]|uniref:Putative aliphatic sulfonates transport permease protein SsuC n=1 Tax=mine drainage metagenome TaxID=410659 RepID=A0A1J5QCK3_9ZZZZ
MSAAPLDSADGLALGMHKPASGGARWRERMRIRAAIPNWAYVLLSVFGFLLPLLVWQLVAASGWVGALFLPSPGAVVHSFVDWTHNGLSDDTLISIYRVVMGFVIAAVIGVPLGIYIGAYKWFEALLQPINDFVRYMPASAFIPLVLLWVGIGEGSKIAIIFIGVIFQIIVMVADAVRRVPENYLEVAYTMGATQGEVLGLVIWRSVLPELLDILRINMGWAWTYLVVAEMVAANSGLGFQILQSQRFLNTPKIFVGIFVIGLIGLLFDLAFRWIYRLVFPWKRA